MKLVSKNLTRYYFDHLILLTSRVYDEICFWRICKNMYLQIIIFYYVDNSANLKSYVSCCYHFYNPEIWLKMRKLNISKYFVENKTKFLVFRNNYQNQIFA